MDFPAALEYLESFTDYEKPPGVSYTAANFDLRRMEELLSRLDNPQHAQKSVHIAGTKGKGSTAAMIAAALVAAGYRVGLFTSPHLHSVRERLAVNGEPIPEGEFARLMSRMEPHVAAVNADERYGRLTTFELLTALAFLHFRECAVDFQVLEVGLGGRLDATNVVQAPVCVITSISLDHTAILGPTVAHIAAEKAGIIKEGCTVIVAPQPPEAAAVIQAVAAEKKATLVQVGRDVTWRKQAADLSGQAFVVQSDSDSYELWVPLLGAHQRENAAGAVAALEALGPLGFPIAKAAIVKGLSVVAWPARLQILSRAPLLVVDGAHNVDSMRKLRAALEECFDFKEIILIMGVSADKDLGGMVRELASLVNRVLATQSSHPRSVASRAIAQEFQRQGVAAEEASSVAEAVHRALSLAGPQDLICVTGSIFVAAEAIAAYGTPARVST